MQGKAGRPQMMEALCKVGSGIGKFPQKRVKIWWHVKGPRIPYELGMFIPWGRSIKSLALSLADDHKALRCFKQGANTMAVDDGPVHAQQQWGSECHKSCL